MPQAQGPTDVSIGVCYYPEHWPEAMWAEDARRMREAGISRVRIGEFAWSRLEPEPGTCDFAWLGRALDTLHGEGLQVILGTPTATPPKWLVDSMPDMLPVDRHGRPRGFASRRHYCFSHAGYRRECARIVRALAEAFGQHPAVVAWQTDNEYGCHDTVLSYSDEARLGFRHWLRDRYGSVAALNEAWGNVFWSMEYRSFEEIDLPAGTVTEANPAHRTDFHRYSSDQVAAFNRVQTDILRALSPGRDILHNFMTFFLDFDHFEVMKDLDIATWDSYPLGSLDVFPGDAAYKAAFMRTGDPDLQAFHHDLYRGAGRGRFWVMEQQPGPVNWAQYNTDALPGLVRLWGMEGFAHGAETISYFRWRQAPFAQEQFHAGLNLPNGEPDRAFHEVKQLSADLAALGPLGAPISARVALIFSYEAAWFLRVQPQGRNFSYVEQVFAMYRSLRRLGLDVDVVGPDADVSGYALVLVPSMPHVPDRLAASLAACEGTLLVAARSGSRTAAHRIPDNLAPGILAGLLGIKVTRAESFRAYGAVSVRYDNEAHRFDRWREFVVPASGTEVLAETEDGHPALTRKARAHYLAGWPDDAFLDRLVERLAREAGLAVLDLPAGLRTRRRGPYRFVFNYGPVPADISPHFPAREVVLGQPLLDVGGVAVLHTDV
ncbi:MAG: beta-galactosidase [Parvibaculum sp.]|uniref:beta-galactosidase n=1 Tax=Parvibaculum sp. TaxID=2024848 RepID=UPI00272FEB39|nr:beta-galactosidase [Parvibaculum sp.]MDP1628582.1 beta-galactosidase [Parvibaculum sp.]MDP2150078.1 beta-galactosidase [Parvibaculum sp.]